MSEGRSWWPGLVLVLFASLWVGLAIQPVDRPTWALENVLVVIVIPYLIFMRRRIPLSDRAYLLLFIFLCMHEIGAHYTYSEVPYDEWWHAATGRTLSEVLGWQRNHFDRLAHLCSGILLAPVVREAFLVTGLLEKRASRFFTFACMVAGSGLYELFEWLAAVVFGDKAMAYLGAQGDEWDSQKDMALAAGGTLVSLGAGAIFSRYRDSGARFSGG